MVYMTMKVYRTTIIILAILFGLTFVANSTTWSPKECICPICGHKHEYQEISSYGGYIYNWSSKFQYVFWPLMRIKGCPYVKKLIQ